MTLRVLIISVLSVFIMLPGIINAQDKVVVIPLVDEVGVQLNSDEIEKICEALDRNNKIPPAALKCPKIVFITESTYQGNLGGITGADEKCQTAWEHNYGEGEKTFKAWISDGTTTPANSFVRSPYGYVRIDRQVVANDWDDLTDGSLDARIIATDTGRLISSPVWTNVGVDGSADPDGSADCLNWNTTVYPNSGNTGHSENTAREWTDDTYDYCENYLRLFCFEQ